MFERDKRTVPLSLRGNTEGPRQKNKQKGTTTLPEGGEGKKTKKSCET